MTRILFVSPDRVGPQMAGPGIRSYELARRLARAHDVLLAAPIGSEALPDAPLAVYDPERPRTLETAAGGRAVVVAPPLAPRLAAAATRRARWIVDLYNPEPFEGLEFQKGLPAFERRVRDAARIDRITFAARAGAAFVCASERQRDMWLGYLAANRRLDSARYADDPELRSLIDVVELGVPEEPPRTGPPQLRGPVFGEDARILVWNGGLWGWLDPLTVIRALALLRRDDPSWCLAFLGTSRPSVAADMDMGERAAALAAELGLGEGAVHFRPGWTPYEERGALLLECDVGVSAHHRTLETRFAYRTRMLDFAWARLPVVWTDGDEWADRIAARGLGEVVPPGDAEAFAAAAHRVTERGREAYARALTATAAAQRWTGVAQPLLALVERVDQEQPRRLGLVARAARARHSAAGAVARQRSRG